VIYPQPALFGGNQFRIPQYFQVVGNGGLRQGKVTFNLTNTDLSITPAENIQNLQTDGVAEGFESVRQFQGGICFKAEFRCWPTVEGIDGFRLV